MTYVVRLEGQQPLARDDGNPWTQVRIEESTAPTGPWEALETIVLSPVDADPTNPAVRDFTSALAERPSDWFRAVFIDATAAEWIHEPIYFSTAGGRLPTLAEFIEYSNIKKPEKEPLLQAALDAAIDHVRKIPRQLDLLPPADTDPPVTITRRTNGRRLIRVPDARAVTEVKVDGVVISASDYELRTCRAPTAVYVEIPSAVWDGLAGSRAVAEVTGRFGMDPLPDDLRQAILALALRRYRERTIGDGTSGGEEYGVRPLPPFPAHTFKAYSADAVALV